jgi:hypothetical protein
MDKLEGIITCQRLLALEEAKDFSEGKSTFDFVPEFEKDAMYRSDGETLFLDDAADVDEDFNEAEI